jgi:TonB family protein
VARGNARRAGRGGEGVRDNSDVSARGGSGKGVKSASPGGGDGAEPGVGGEGRLSDGGRRSGRERDGELADSGNAGRTPRANRDARPLSDPNPVLTDEMKQRKLNARITVNVEVDVDGSHSEEILTGSGDDEVDALILKAMRRWKWAPAIVDGSPKKQKFRYRFTINVK